MVVLLSPSVFLYSKRLPHSFSFMLGKISLIIMCNLDVERYVHIKRTLQVEDDDFSCQEIMELALRLKIFSPRELNII